VKKVAQKPKKAKKKSKSYAKEWLVPVFRTRTKAPPGMLGLVRVSAEDG